MRALVLALAVCTTSTPPPPSDPVAAQLLDTFAMHDVVVLDEGGHGNENTHAFLDRLLRDPRTAHTIDDIVVEFGTARHQAVIDRFVAGGDVGDAELRRVWQDTTQVLVWEAPVYERFFRTVREVNRALPAAQRLRVVLGDPPIDWSTVHTFADWTRSKRDQHAADVIEREVLAKQRKALVIYGAMHVKRGTGMLVDQLEAKRRVYTVEVTEDAGPRFIGERCERRADDEMCDRPAFDAQLALGPATWSEPSPAVVTDDAYYAELVRRAGVLSRDAVARVEELRARARGRRTP